MTHDEWVQAALDARIEQGFPIEIEDPATLDFLADVFSRAGDRAMRSRVWTVGDDERETES